MVALTEAVAQHLRDNGFDAYRTTSFGGILTLDLVYGPRSFDWTTLTIEIDDHIEVYPPGTACLLRISMADPSSFDKLLEVVKRCHSDLLAHGIDAAYSSGWLFGNCIGR